jgi:hypothetical protein
MYTCTEVNSTSTLPPHSRTHVHSYHLPGGAIGTMRGVVIARSTFRHVSTISSEEALTVRLLMITLIPFTSEFSVSTANEFDTDMLRLVSTGLFDMNCTLLPFVIQASVSEFPVVQVQVTVPPGHTDGLSQSTKGTSIDI